MQYFDFLGYEDLHYFDQGFVISSNLLDISNFSFYTIASFMLHIWICQVDHKKKFRHLTIAKDSCSLDVRKLSPW